MSASAKTARSVCELLLCLAQFSAAAQQEAGDHAQCTASARRRTPSASSCSALPISAALRFVAFGAFGSMSAVKSAP